MCHKDSFLEIMAQTRWNILVVHYRRKVFDNNNTFLFHQRFFFNVMIETDCILYTYGTFNCIVSAMWFHLNHRYIPPGCKLEVCLRAKVTSPVVGATPCLDPIQPPPLLLLFWNISTCFYAFNVKMQHNHCLWCHRFSCVGAILLQGSQLSTGDFPILSCLHRAHTKQHSHWNW